MKSIFAAAGASVLAIAIAMSAAAQSQAPGVSNPANMVRNFSVPTVGPVLNELGVAWRVQTLSSGQQYIEAVYGDALQFVIFFTACKSATGECYGMNSVAFFDAEVNPQTVQAFNFRYQFASAGVNPEGTAYISRYDVADYGVPRGNIASSIVNFAQLAAMFSKELDSAHRTVSLEGYASDMSATHLNQQTIVSMTGREIEPASPLLRHEVSFEDTAEIVQRLISDENVPRNKIDNKLERIDHRLDDAIYDAADEDAQPDESEGL